MKNDNPGHLPAVERSATVHAGAATSAGKAIRNADGLICHSIDLRVRYQETDAQGHVHHSTFVNWFEIGRIELLRAIGHSYRDLEEQGLFLVVAEVGCNYLAPAFYDDVLTLTTTVTQAKGARIRHDYDVRRGDDPIAHGFTVVASVGRDGRVRRLPDWLRLPETVGASGQDVLCGEGSRTTARK
jgi:acyl-CoA thioester hydrolase